ncbi:MAG: xanthine dehydrogenase family protein molybdopterin-binding subunit [Spirochaetales bacterium]|nr:xanthine dehydrogenase family protein molybdopterin-binding subunit [Spirochaetales bacterium]
MSVREKEHQKLHGEAIFTNDIHPDNLLNAIIVRSTVKEGSVKEIKLPKLPTGYFIFTEENIPGDKFINFGAYNMPFFGSKNISYIGEGICLLAGPDVKTCRKLSSEIEIIYQKKPEKNPDEKTEKSVSSRYELNLQKEWPKSMKKTALSYNGTVKFRRPMILEPETITTLKNKDDLILYAPAQNPYILKNLLTSVLKISPNRIKIIVPFICDPFYQKTASVYLNTVYCSIITMNTGRPCKLTLGKEAQYLYSPGSPDLDYKFYAKIDEDNKLSAIEMNLDFHTGAYPVFSHSCNDYSAIAAKGLYQIDSFVLNVNLQKDNKAPTQIGRGYCEPQVHHAIESFLNHFAQDQEQNPLETRLDLLISSHQQKTKRNYAPDYHEFLQSAALKADFSRKWTSYQRLHNKNSYATMPTARRGIGMAFCPHYIYPCTDYENQNYKITCTFDKNKKLRIQSSLVDINQSRSYTLSIAAAKVLNLHISEIIFEAPKLENTRKPEPLEHLRTMTLVKMVEDACRQIKSKLKRLKPPISVAKRIIWPKINVAPFDDLLPESLEATFIEVEIDPIFLQPQIRGVWVDYYIGPRIHEDKIRPQIQSALNFNLSQVYKMPKLKALASKTEIEPDYGFITARNQPGSVIDFNTSGDSHDRSRSLGHLPVTGAAPAFKAAVEQAMGIKILNTPFSAQDLYKETTSIDH